MTSYLIVGPDEKTLGKAKELCLKENIDQFDISIITGDKETSVGIELIKKIHKTVFLKPLRSSKKAIVIPNAQILTIPAQNALLKLLEEPPEHTLFFLLTSSPEALLPTIKSRCHITREQADEIVITTEEYEQLKKNYTKWTTADVGSLLKMAEQLAKDKEKINETFRKMTLVMRDRMSDLIEKNQPLGQLPQQLIALQKANLILSSTNTSPRLVLEHFFLSIKLS